MILLRIHEQKLTEALLDTLFIIILTAARLAALQQTAEHDLFRGRVENDERALAHRLVKLERLVHLAREAVDQEAAATALPTLSILRLMVGRRGRVIGGGSARLDGIAHGVLEKLDGDLHGHDVALTDVGPDELAVLAPFAVLLGAQQITGWILIGMLERVRRRIVIALLSRYRSRSTSCTSSREEARHT